MRKYIKNEIRIDGRNIPYPVYTAFEYLMEHDRMSESDAEDFTEANYDLYQKINQIIALKQSCYLMRRVCYSCGSLSEDLYALKLELIREISEKYNYKFDDDWMEGLVAKEGK